MRHALFGVWLLFALVSLPANSEEPDTLFTQREQLLDDVDIEGHTVSRSVTATMPTQQMSQLQMRSIGAQNVADVLRHFAGTNVKDYGGIGGMKTVSIRGLSASHTGISYDGILVSNCQAGQVDIGRFPISNLSCVTLSTGQDEDLTSSARALATGSLLRLTTKSESDAPVGKTSVEVLLKGGSFGYVDPSLFVSRRLKDSLYVSAFANSTFLDGSYPYRLTNGQQYTREYRLNTDLRSLTSECNIGYSFHQRHTIAAKSYLTLSERGLPGAVILYNPYSKERLADHNAFLQTQYSYQQGDWQVVARAKYNHAYDRYTDTNVKYAGGVQTDLNRQDEYYLQATAVWQPSPVFGMSLAQDGVVNTLSSNLPSCPFPTRLSSFTSLQAYYERNWFKVHGSLLGTFVTEQVRIGNPPADRHKVTPTASVSLRPWESQSLFVRFMYKETYRMPAFNDLYYFRVGNKNLQPEWARELGLGLTWDLPVSGLLQALSLTSDVYHNRVQNKIVAFPTTYVWKMANYGRVRIHGLDVTLSASTLPIEGWSAAASLTYSLQQAIDVTDESSSSYGLQLPYTPVHSGSGHLLVTMPWCQLGYSVVAASCRYSLMDRSSHYRLDGYAEHNLTISRSFHLHDSDLEAQAEALNVTGCQYEIIQYYPMPLQQFRFSLKWHL